MIFLLLACTGAAPPDSATGADALQVDLTHRATAVSCAAERPDDPPADATCGTHADDTCASHADCTAGTNGRCLVNPDFGSCGCAYDECSSDADCGGTAVCGCAGVAPQEDQLVDRCMASDCRTDGDCASGLCLADRMACGDVDDATQLDGWGYFCATEADTCRSDTVCTDPTDFCVYDGAAWTCSNDYAMTCE